ncbi:MAG: serine/threonine-protein kinase [Verrucomicrobiales bacterium]
MNTNDPDQTMPDAGACPRCGEPLDCAIPVTARAARYRRDAPTAAPYQSPPEPPEPPPLDEVQAAFPQLEILALIGAGSMGVVYKARQKSLNRLVALKLLAPHRKTEPGFAERFSREAQALAALSHPNIVTIHDSRAGGRVFLLLMESVDGVNSRQAIRAGRFTPEQALAIVPPICEALQTAHDAGIVHRDIKPENLLMDKAGNVKVADFGVARILGANDPLAPDPGGDGGLTAGAKLGTPKYMAPEQADRPGAVDHRADIYSLGAVLYEMLTGEPPQRLLQPPSKRVHIDVKSTKSCSARSTNRPNAATRPRRSSARCWRRRRITKTRNPLR